MPKRKHTLNTHEAAEMLGCSPSTIRRMVANGEIQGHKLRPSLPNSPLRIDKASVEKLLRRRQN